MAEKEEIKLTGRQVLRAYELEKEKLRDIQDRKQQLQQLLSETVGAEQGLKEIQNAGKNRQMLVSLGAGIYAEAKLESNTDVKTGLGNGIVLKTSIVKALEELGKRKEGIQKDIEFTHKDEEVTMQNLNNLGSSIESARQRKIQKSKA